jgi:hypothetical protein
MGGNNFTQLKIMENIASQNVKIMPDVLIGGGGDSANGGISGLWTSIARTITKEKH